MKKRTLEHMLALVLCLCLLLPGGAAAASRQTSPAAAYQSGTVMEIATAEDLKLFAQQVAVDRGTDGKLVADIDLAMEGVWNPMGGSWDSDGYSGTFDGNGHTITGLHGNSLFNAISGAGTVRDLTLAEVNITGSAPLARLSFGTVENCHAEGRLRAIDIMYIGGLVARVEEGAVLNSSATVDITAQCTEYGAQNFGYYEVGGVAGYLGGRMDGCTYTGDITATGLVPGCGIIMGGVVGFLSFNETELRNSGSRGTITVAVQPSALKEPGQISVGGVCGSVNSSVKVRNCYHIGDISVSMPDDQVSAGGIDGDYLPGYFYSNKYENCWTTGRVSIQSSGPQATFSRREDLSLYFVGEGAEVGSQTGQRLTQASLTDGTLLRRLNDYVAAQGGDELFLWVQTAQGPVPQGMAYWSAFSDVAQSDYFFQSVIWAVAQGVTTGTSSTTFSPDRKCSQAEILTFLWRAAGKPEPLGSGNPFTNPVITPEQYYYEPLRWAYYSYMTGDPGMDPNQPCTRLEAVYYIWCVAGCPEGSVTTSFTDVDDFFLAQAVSWAVDAGVTTGTSSTTFSPYKVCSRGEIVTFLYRYFSQLPEDDPLFW